MSMKSPQTKVAACVLTVVIRTHLKPFVSVAVVVMLSIAMRSVSEAIGQPTRQLAGELLRQQLRAQVSCAHVKQSQFWKRCGP